MGKTAKSTLPILVAGSVALVLTSCTSNEPERVEPPATGSAPMTVDAEPVDRLSNRLVALTDFQGRPLYVLPEGQTQRHLNAVATQPPFERGYTPAQCAPDTAFTPAPEGLDAVVGRSHISEDQSRLRVEIYTAPNEAELVEYFVGAEPDAPLRCTDYTVETNGINQHFSYAGVGTPPVAPHSRSIHYSLTQDETTTHHFDVAAVNGTVAARVTLSTVNPANQAMIDAVMNIAQQATN